MLNIVKKGDFLKYKLLEEIKFGKDNEFYFRKGLFGERIIVNEESVESIEVIDDSGKVYLGSKMKTEMSLNIMIRINWKDGKKSILEVSQGTLKKLRLAIA